MNSPKIKQLREYISIKWIHNYAAETNFKNFLREKKVEELFQDFSSIFHFFTVPQSLSEWIISTTQNFQHEVIQPEDKSEDKSDKMWKSVGCLMNMLTLYYQPYSKTCLLMLITRHAQ